MWIDMKKSKINIGIIAAFLIIAIFNQCRDAKITRESKVADEIKISATEVKLEDILTPPTESNNIEIVEYYMNDVPKTR